MKLSRVVAWMLCGTPLLMAADSPLARRTQRPDPPPRISSPKPADGDADAATGDETKWEQVQVWMARHCPNRMQFLERRMSINPRLEQARKLMIRRYDQIQNVRYAPMQNALINELEAQDQIFGGQIELRRSRGDRAAEAKAEADLHAAVTRLFDGRLAIKRIQIKRHQDEIDRLSREVAAQEQRRQQVVETWFKNMRSRADNAVGGPPRRPPVQNAAPDDANRPAQDE